MSIERFPLEHATQAELDQVEEAMHIVLKYASPNADKCRWQQYWAQRFIDSCKVGGRNPQNG